MAPSVSIDTITAIRRYPRTYRVLRWLWRRVSSGCWSGLRLVVPQALPIGPSKGTFSALELLMQGKLEGRLIEEAHPNPETGPKPLRKLTGTVQGDVGSWPIFWTRHRNARLVGKTLVVQDHQKRICYEAAFGSFGSKRDAAYNYLYLPAPVSLCGNWTSVISQWSEGFCEWFLVALARLRLLHELPLDTRVLVPPHLSSYQKDTLSWLGLDGRYRPTDETHLLLENFYFVSPPTMAGCYDPFTHRFLRERFLERADHSYNSPPRFYIRRVGRSRGIVNEADVINILEERGWPVIDTERLTMAQQVQLFSQAEAICTVHGAALTNLLWCRPDTRVLEIVADTYINGVYEGLSALLGIDHRFLLCRGDHAFRARVDTVALRRELDRLE